MTPERLCDSRLGLFAGRVRLFGAVASTNDIALAWGEEGVPEGAVAVAESQHQGRGRLGRPWVSPAGAGLYVSVLLRPNEPARRLLTLATGVALAEGVEESTGVGLVLKWPNDLCVIDAARVLRKVGGVLAEAGGERRRHVVVGFGINVTAAAVPPALAARATSLEDERRRPVDMTDLLASCLSALSARYAQLQRGEGLAVLAAWRALARATYGRLVEWEEGLTVRRGTIDDIDDTGALLVRTADGQRSVVAGEVRFCG